MRGDKAHIGNVWGKPFGIHEKLRLAVTLSAMAVVVFPFPSS